MEDSAKINGIINLDKPPGITSASALHRIKRLLPRGNKIGHAGTLDPFATGVLLVLIGKATKTCESLMGQPKAYETTVKLGARTETDDLESTEIPIPNSPQPTLEDIRNALLPMIGLVQQRPPNYSAMKIGGLRAYKLAREGLAVPIQSREVRIDALEIIAWEWPLLKLRIDCGRGTYIRAIARDLGQSLNTGGYLTQLRRTRVGKYQIAQAVTLDRLLAEGIEPHLQPI